MSSYRGVGVTCRYQFLWHTLHLTRHEPSWRWMRDVLYPRRFAWVKLATLVAANDPARDRSNTERRPKIHLLECDNFRLLNMNNSRGVIYARRDIVNELKQCSGIRRLTCKDPSDASTLQSSEQCLKFLTLVRHNSVRVSASSEYSTAKVNGEVHSEYLKQQQTNKWTQKEFQKMASRKNKTYFGTQS